jgi:ATP adenylyltransferase
MERIYAPWRHEYVSRAGTGPGGCVLCQAATDAEHPLVVHRALRNLVVMNLFPYNSGHVMVAPLRHVADLRSASNEELAEMLLLAQRLEGVMAEVYHPDGLNIGMNIGKPAGAGVADHIHLHVVPRWSGDSNFMTVVSDTRVHPEDPVRACARLRACFA